MLRLLAVKFFFYLLMSQLMRFLFLAWVAGIGLAGCNPALNWRDVRPEGTNLGLLMPCKPNTVVKKVDLAGQSTSMQLSGCDAADLTFALSSAEVAEAAQASTILAAWQQATLANMKAAKADSISNLKIKGAVGSPAVWVKATGKRPDGTAVVGHAAYFAQGTTVFQAVIYGTDIKADVAETYFSGLKFE